MTAKAPTAQPATQQLLDLAEATRPDINRRDLEGVICEARDAGKTWPVILAQTARMLARGESVRNLRHALIDPLGLRKGR